MSVLDQLTQRQQQVYQFIHEKITQRGYGPTVREIGERFGISSPNGVMCHLKALEKKGLIHRSPNKSRAIELTREAIDAEKGLPLAGKVAAGMTQLAFEQQERIDFSDFFNRPDMFVLQVIGRIDDRGADRGRRLCGRFASRRRHSRDRWWWPRRPKVRPR